MLLFLREKNQHLDILSLICLKAVASLDYGSCACESSWFTERIYTESLMNTIGNSVVGITQTLYRLIY